MYCVVVQNELFIVERVISCDTMLVVQQVLEDLQPEMDAEYLVSGQASTCTWCGKTYSFRKLEHAEQPVDL